MRAWSTGGSSPLRLRFFLQSTTSAVGVHEEDVGSGDLVVAGICGERHFVSPELRLSVSCAGGVISKNPLSDVFDGSVPRSPSDVGVEPFGVGFVEVGVPDSGTDEGAFVAGR